MQRSMEPASRGNGNDEEMDKKPSANLPDAPGGSSMPMKHGFAFAMENLKPEELPGYVKQYFNALTFPEKLMLMLVHIEKMSAKEGRSGMNLPVTWTADGTAFVIRNKDELVKKWLPLFFSQAKFSSFTRKLYRWGFRKTMIPKEGGKGGTEVAFGNIYFRRGDHTLMSEMRSITAAKLRRESSNEGERQDLDTDSPARPGRVASLQGDTSSSYVALSPQPPQGYFNTALMSTTQPLHAPAANLLASRHGTLSEPQQFQGVQNTASLASQHQGGQYSLNLAALGQVRQLGASQQPSPDLALLSQLAQLQGDQTTATILSSLMQLQQLQGHCTTSGAASLPGSAVSNAALQQIAPPQQLTPPVSVNAQQQSIAINPQLMLALLLQQNRSLNSPQIQLPSADDAVHQLSLQRSLLQGQGVNLSQLVQGNVPTSQLQGQQQQQQPMQREQQQEPQGEATSSDEE